MPISPPEEPLDFRGKSITPQSPKPLHFPSPSTIPFLERQMDPSLSATVTEAPPLGDSMAISNDNAALGIENALLPKDLAEIKADGMEGFIIDTIGKDPDTLTATGATVQSSDSNLLASSNLPFNELLSTETIPEPAAHAPAELASVTSHIASQQTSDPILHLAHISDSTETNAYPVNNLSISADSTLQSGGVDFAALLNSISPQFQTIPQTHANSSVPLDNQPPTASSLLPPPQNSSLPPRPQGQGTPGVDPNLSRDQSASYIAQNAMPAPLLASGSNVLAPPMGVPFQQTSLPAYPLPSPTAARPGSANDDDGPFPPELEHPYEEFLQEERQNVTDAKWERFPEGSRLFIGNLPTEKVTKRDVFRRFHKYGKLAQISLKQAYGFVQFVDVDSCSRAKETEQDAMIKGRKMHLEISRPQNKTGKDRNGRRRSRSPDFNRSRGDRYTGSAASPRERDNRRGRDDYRPGRSPSPRGYRRNKSPDHYDGRRRSRSRSPYGRNSRQRDNRREEPEDDLPLPRRATRDVPEVQIIVLDDLDRGFIAHIENIFKDRGIRCDVLLLSPRLSEQAVIKRQILEGVSCVVRLTRMSIATGKLSLQLFDRRHGQGDVRFEQYEDLDPNIATELVIRARQTHNPQNPPPSYPPQNSSSYGIPTTYGLPQQPAQPDYSSLLTQLGSRPDLQAVLRGMQQQQAIPGAAQVPGQTTDLAQLLAAATANQQQAAAYATPSQQKALQVDYASLLAGAGAQAVPGVPLQHAGQAQQRQQQQQQQQKQPDMQELMAQLAKYQR